MATLAFSLAGQFVGGLVGGPIGATVGRALGALAGSGVDGVLFGDRPRASTPSDFRLQGSLEGGAIARLYGWSRLSGNIIWATELEELGGETAGAKAMSQPREDEIGASFAVGLCEGEVHRLGRIWADGQLLETEGLTIRFYRGTAGQLPDSLIEAKQGADAAPAYRGLCYIVFERLPLSGFGNRIPNISVEICRMVGELEPAIRAVTVIPGSTEFGYDPSPRVRLLGPGASVGENTHMAADSSDWTLSIDELQALCPNLEHVALVVAWFGDDLRCGHCRISPRVEGRDRVIEGVEWSVAGHGRAEVPVVSQHGGGPAYGGTPSDASVSAAIADLKRRGIAVTLYPIVMMDVAHGNVLPDPHGGGSQAAYPWRGRITCMPAPGQAGTPDKTGAAVAQIAAFAGGGFGDMVRHYAQLAEAAGGVDAMIIGSEMRGLTTVRGAGNSFPFVDVLVELAAEVRAIVGTDTRITYAADWSEYGGYQVDGEKFFHLDPLWSSVNIDAVGIDNYMPIADWREGDDHADAGVASSIYDLDYLQANIAGGEGFDWYYGSDADRQAGVRSSITDGAYGEPFVWRSKDLRGWWSNLHHDRPGGIRAVAPTAWVPGSKPIWFTELGCGAVDKGANQPNVFGDPKSAENARPHFSSGAPDPLMQRQFLRAHQRFWGDADNNPAGMVDTGRMYLWTWDARPFPAFPALTDVWSDGDNHRTGHWLTGRVGTAASDELIGAIAADHDVTLVRVEGLPPVIHGLALNGAMSCRDALVPVLSAAGLSIHASADGLVVRRPQRHGALAIAADGVVLGERPVLARRRPDPTAAIGRMAMAYVDRERDYLTGTVTAMRLGDGALTSENSPLVLDVGAARAVAERLLAEQADLETLEFTLPPSALAVEIGDVVALDGQREGPFVVTQIRDGAARQMTAQTLPSNAVVASTEQRPGRAAEDFVRAAPLVMVAHLPPGPDDPQRSRLAIGAFGTPWPGFVDIVDEATGVSVVRVTHKGALGELAAAFGGGPSAGWDDANVLEVKLYGGHLASLSEASVVAGVNRLAVENDAGDWEVIGFAQAELVGPSTYTLTHLLRGLQGTAYANGHAGAGRRVMVLDGKVAFAPMDRGRLEQVLALSAYAGRGDLTGRELVVTPGLNPVLPKAPTGASAHRATPLGDVVFGWIAASRANDADWIAGVGTIDHGPPDFRVRIWSAGAVVRTISASATGVIYAATEQISDFGAPPTEFDFTIHQVSGLWGDGHRAEGQFNG